MGECELDQASGLRRLFGAALAMPVPRPLCFVAREPALARAGMLSMVDALTAADAVACVDWADGTALSPAWRLSDDPERVAGTARAADGLDLVVQGRAGPTGITDLYGHLKQLVAKYPVARLGVLLVGQVDPGIGARCRSNLAQVLDRMTGTRIEFWSALGSAALLHQAAAAGTSVQALDPAGSESREFGRLADWFAKHGQPRAARLH